MYNFAYGDQTVMIQNNCEKQKMADMYLLQTSYNSNKSIIVIVS